MRKEKPTEPDCQTQTRDEVFMNHITINKLVALQYVLFTVLEEYITLIFNSTVFVILIPSFLSFTFTANALVIS